jgi:hypothetical protein
VRKGWAARHPEIEEGFIAQKARDGTEVFTARAPFGMTGVWGTRGRAVLRRWGDWMDAIGGWDTR